MASQAGAWLHGWQLQLAGQLVLVRVSTLGDLQRNLCMADAVHV